jgi:hypothetical protein
MIIKGNCKSRAWVNIERETNPRDPEIQKPQLPLEIQKPQPLLEIQSAPQPSCSHNDQTHSTKFMYVCIRILIIEGHPDSQQVRD